MAAPEMGSRAEAVELVRRSVGRDDRILVTGGSGWFGRTTISLLWHALGPDWIAEHVLATASRARLIEVLGCGQVAVSEALIADVPRFAPTVIVNCAFPTPGRVADMGSRGYIRVAEGMTEALLESSALRSVERVVTFSTGAAVPSVKYPADIRVNPYGVLKAREESALLSIAQRTGISAQACRVWAVSGPHVQSPDIYAFSAFVLQALREGRIDVKATRPVIREYAGVDDVVALALAELSHGSGCFDTGGIAVEMGALAAAVARHVPRTTVRRQRFDPGVPSDDYRAASAAWDELCSDHGLTPAGLDEQIQAVAAHARSWC